MTASILFIAGDTAVQRHVFERFRSAYWSAGFECILEKHGILDYDRRAFDVFDEAAALRSYRILIVAWLPAELWQPHYLQRLREFDGIVLLEGPLPQFVEEAVGFARHGVCTKTAKLEVLDRDLAQHLRACPLPQPFKGGFQMAPKRVETHPTLDSCWHPNRCNLDDFASTCAQITATSWAAYILRLRRGKYFPNPTSNLLMLMLLLRYDQRGRRLDRDDVVRARDLLATIRVEELAIQAVPLYRRVDADLAALGMDAARAADWRARVRPYLNIGARLSVFAPDLRGVACSALVALLCGRWRWSYQTQVTLRALLTLENGEPRLRKPLSTLDLHRLAIALCGARQLRAARAVLTRALRMALDPLTGVMRGGTFAPDGFTAGSSAVADPIIPLAYLVAGEAGSARHAVAAGVRADYDPVQVACWEAAPFWLELGEAHGGETLVRARSGKCSGSALYRSGKFLVCGFQALAAIVHFHTMAPLRESFQACEPDDAILLEAMLLRSLERHARAYAATYMRVRPWPRDYQFALTVRHDVDRVPAAEQFNALLDFEQVAALPASWYWIHDRLQADYLQRLRTVGHEIALHATDLERKPRELAAVATAAGIDMLKGESLHGGGGDFWLGHASVRAAEQVGLRYTEGVPSVMDFPYRFPALGAHGEISLSEICCLTHNYSVDDGVSRKRRFVRNDTLLAPRQAAGHYVVVLNHPDLNFESLRQLTAQLAAQDCWKATAASVAAWWRRTHRRDALDIARIGSDEGVTTYELTATHTISDLPVELLGYATAGIGPSSAAAGALVQVVSVRASVPLRVTFAAAVR